MFLENLLRPPKNKAKQINVPQVLIYNEEYTIKSRILQHGLILISSDMGLRFEEIRGKCKILFYFFN